MKIKFGLLDKLELNVFNLKCQNLD